MATRPRLTQGDRREVVLDAGAALFAERAYDDVLMEDVGTRAGISRALLYRHFPSKRDLFAGVYARAADRLLVASPVDPALPLEEQVRAGLDEHLSWFQSNSQTVLTANRTLAGDPTVQAIINEELSVLRERLIAALPVPEVHRALVSTVLMSWLLFVRALSVEWLATGCGTRDEVLAICTGALFGALAPLLTP